jgi:hypothetical protein
MTRKNYSEYKDGLPVVDLTAAKLKMITDKHMCVKTTALVDGKRIKLRVRLKPAKKMTLAEEVKFLRTELRKLAKAQVRAV